MVGGAGAGCEVLVAGEEFRAGDPAEYAVDERGDEGPGGLLAVEPARFWLSVRLLAAVRCWAHSSGQRRA